MDTVFGLEVLKEYAIPLLIVLVLFISAHAVKRDFERIALSLLSGLGWGWFAFMFVAIPKDIYVSTADKFNYYSCMLLFFGLATYSVIKAIWHVFMEEAR
jgi:hypothetical protein